MDDQELVCLDTLLKCIADCSEKAACIAQVCRSDQNLFQLLVQEKEQCVKNTCFVQDFKTLADVLVQETVKWEVSKKFPSLKPNIQGEENNHFENALGESIDICISDVPEETVDLLCKVLDGRKDIAKTLATALYSNPESDVESLLSSDVSFPAKGIGIWIDPIDCTGEYVRASNEVKVDSSEEIAPNGLKCVSVLIGAYNLVTGIPFMGVVNQPFFSFDLSQNRWKSKYYWGVCSEGTQTVSVVPRPLQKSRKKIVASSFEEPNLLELMKLQYDVQFVCGAGYKALVVACGNANLYALSHATTHFWDMCGPHAILLALGGGIVDFRKSVSKENCTKSDLLELQTKYTSCTTTTTDVAKPYCNIGGVIAYLKSEDVIEFVQFLQQNKYVMR